MKAFRDALHTTAWHGGVYGRSVNVLLVLLFSLAADGLQTPPSCMHASSRYVEASESHMLSKVKS